MDPIKPTNQEIAEEVVKQEVAKEAGEVPVEGVILEMQSENQSTVPEDEIMHNASTFTDGTTDNENDNLPHIPNAMIAPIPRLAGHFKDTHGHPMRK